MAKIDGRRGRIAGIHSTITTPSRFATPGDLGLAAVAAALGERAQENEIRREKAERDEDNLALANAASEFRISSSKHLDAAAEGFDGTGGPFADNVALEFDDQIETIVAAHPDRRQDRIKARLVGIGTQQKLAALDVEDTKRDAALFSGLANTAEQETNAILSDPAHYTTALENLEPLAEAVPPALRAKFIQDASDGYAAAYGEARLREDPQGYLAELNGGDLDDELSPKVKASHLSSAKREIDRRAREAKTAAEKSQRIATKIVANEVKAIKKAVENGLPVDEARLEELVKVATQADDATRAAASATADTLRAAASMQELPPTKAAEILAQERARLNKKGNATPLEVERVEILENTLDGMQTRLAQDFAGFLVDRAAIEPFNLQELTGEDLTTRATAIDEAAEYYGVEPQYFTEAERAGFERLDPGSPQILQTAAAIAAHPSAGDMLAEIAPQNPELAHLGGVLAAGGDAGFIEDAIAGAAAKREQGFETSISNSNIAGESASALTSEIYGAAFALSPATSRAARNAASLAYEGRSQQRGRIKEDFDPDDFERSLQRAVGGRYVKEGNREVLYGGVAEFGRHRVHVPGWMKANDFERNFKKLDAADYEKAGGTAFDGAGNEIDLRDLRGGVPVAIAEGRYQIAFGDPAIDPQWVLGADAAPYVFDFNTLRAKSFEPALAVTKLPRAF